MRTRGAYITLLALCVVSFMIWKIIKERRAETSSAVIAYSVMWDPKAAERYLDSREVWWQNWPAAQLDHGTVCISCHTVLPYALLQPGLRRKLETDQLEPPEEVMLASIWKRVDSWVETTPYYTDAAYGPGKTEESHATEAVLNAVILSSYDAAQGHLGLRTRKAFEEAWTLQQKTGEDAGSWKWQNFHLAPWEASESAYQGAALMAVAVGNAPDHYANESGTRDNVELLKKYLRGHYNAQPLMSKLYVLWASARIPDLLTPDEQIKLTDEVANLQLSDGGWALSSLDEQSRKHKYLDEWKQLTHTAASDGCATGLVILALEAAGAKQKEKMLQQGVVWLQSHQKKDGSWWAASLNGLSDDESDIGRFMSDAATGYAVLALENFNQNGSNATPQ